MESTTGSYIGYFKSGEYHGKGILKEKDYTYHGEFEQGKFYGKGKIEYSDGRIMKGNWMNNIMHG